MASAALRLVDMKFRLRFLHALSSLGLAGAVLCAFPLLVPGPAGDPEAALPVRGVWVTRWAFKSAADIDSLFDGLAAMGINTVFFQVRGAGDAFYRSSYEPWSYVLAGSLGQDPGWDPLKTAVAEGHKRGLEVHAWVNVFTAWPVTEEGKPPDAALPEHAFLAHPDWVAVDREGRPMPIKKSETRDNYAFFSPTKRDVREHVVKVIDEIVGKYRVDGVHLDYVRFPDSSYSYDAESKVAYLKANLRDSLTFSQWRTDQLTELVGEISRSIGRVRPGTAVSAAVWQLIDGGRTGYYQDAVAWVRKGYVDFLVPMFYTLNQADYRARLETYADSVGAENVVAGIGAYLDGFDDGVLRSEMGLASGCRLRGVCIFNSDFAIRYSHSIRSVLEGEAGGE